MLKLVLFILLYIPKTKNLRVNMHVEENGDYRRKSTSA